MEIEQMAWFMSKLEKGEVPAEVASVGFAGLLIDNWKGIYGDVEGHPHQILFSDLASPVSNWGWAWTSAGRWLNTAKMPSRL